MCNFHKKKLFNQLNKIERTILNDIKHKLQFGGLKKDQESLATLYISRVLIGQRFISVQYQHLIPVGR